MVATDKGNTSCKTFPKKNDVESSISKSDLKLTVEYSVMVIGTCIDAHFL